MKKAKQRTGDKALLLSGAELLALGAMDAGVQFFAGYPITPSSGIYQAMVEWLPGLDGIAIPAPDEISSISYCLGASMSGMLSLTATSGPGFALMTESIGYAVMSQTPVIVVLAQRLGPATGGATTSAQGDLLFALFSISGAYPLPVLAPSNLPECYEAVHRAATIALQATTPVIILTDKELMMTTMSVSFSRRILSSPDFSGFYPNKRIRKITGSVHDEMGRYTDQPERFAPVLNRLRKKILDNAERWRWWEYAQEPESRILVISWGNPSGAIRQAFIQKNSCWSYLLLKTLFPLPRKSLSKILSSYERILFVEENVEATLMWLVQSHFRHLPACETLTSVGELISPGQILQKVQQMEEG